MGKNPCSTMEFLSHLVEDPAYRHVVLNHLPVTGLFVAWIVLVTGLVLRQRSSCLLGLALITLTAGSTLVVMSAGEDAYRQIYDSLNGPGRELLDDHADLAGAWGYALVANASLAALAFLAIWRRPAATTALSASIALLTLASLGVAFVISEAGGRIRHPEFASFGRPPVDGPTVGGPVAMRRLTGEQLATAVHDVFGKDIEIVGRFDPDVRHAGLLAVGSGRMTITAAGFEQNEAMALRVVEQVLAEEKRGEFLSCTPENEEAADDACTETFVREIGSQLFRRSLEPEEIRARVEAAGLAADETKDFDAGLGLALTSLLVSPDFLFRVERTEVDPDSAGRRVITDDTYASRLSFLFWNAPPDAELRAAAASGALSDPAERERQLDRLLASERSADGVRAFFSDLLRFEELDNASKDPLRYAIWNQQIADDAREQTLRIVVDHLLDRDLPYPELFTTRRSFLTRTLGPIYAVPVRAPSGWEETEFPIGHTRTGLLSHAAFHILHSHPGRSSPTLRGKFLRESILCETVPPAPADVEFALFNDDQNEELRTARERLEVHSSEASCRNCHQLTDPIGLGLENFDGIGRHRGKENAATIDPSGELDGRGFGDHIQLGAVFAEHPQLSSCLVENIYRYAVGRQEADTELVVLEQLNQEFEASGYRLRPLLRAIALSESFRTAPGEAIAPSPSSVQAATKKAIGGEA